MEKNKITEHVSDEDKAREIAKKLSHPNIDSFGDGDDEFDTRFYHTNKDAALQAMEWKDEQEIEFLQSLMFQASTQQALNTIINNRIKLLKGE